ncbi:ABC transporter ATP-binding protein [Paenibacillus flagellatus]|uniref:ABC transporter ATP-binding protein n=1 Tax=Paenibacillus flagellatus TaxID=2211139 RepID=A0A2V5KCB9_9BACL|nr:ABC transporter ATP-binding protein [Paenibacillus flagellatus]PYI57249.1 ABC transporter ATP-binding protein [Paenibacillus flagellatus]
MNAFKRFWPYANQVKKLYVWGFVGSLFRFLIPLSVPLVFKYLFDGLLRNDAMSPADKTEQLLVIALLMIVVFFAVRGPMEYMRQLFMHKGNNKIVAAMRKDAFRKVHDLDASYFARHKSGEIGTRVIDDIEKMKGFLTAVFSNVWIELIVLLFVVGAMLTMNAKLTLLAVLLVGFQFALAHVLSKKLKRTTRLMMQERSALSGFVTEHIQGALLSRLFASERRDREAFERHLERYEKLTDKHAAVNALSLSAVNVLSDLTPFLVVAVGCLYVIDGSLTLGSLVAFFAYADRMRSPVAALVQAFPAIAEGSVAMQRVFDFFDTPVTVRESDRPREWREFADAVRFEHVFFGYDGGRDVLKDVSFTLEKGKTYAFVGGSGGGKSTILQLLTRMYDADRGEIRIDGANIKDYSMAGLRRHMGIVTQDGFLYSSSVKDNIRMAKPEAADEEIEAAAKKAFAHEFIRSLPNGYDTEIGERGVKLSGGQRQRISLARVFLKNPAILLLDEATSALDNESEKLVQESIRGLDRGKTVVMIAHRLSTVTEADRIFVLKDGEIVESGSHRELLELDGYYKELYAKQQAAESGAAEAAAPAPKRELKLASGRG